MHMHMEFILRSLLYYSTLSWLSIHLPYQERIQLNWIYFTLNIQEYIINIEKNVHLFLIQLISKVDLITLST